MSAADLALPDETCGLFYQPPGDKPAQLRTFAGEHSPTLCSAVPHEVIAFAYHLHDTHGHVLATFHTHPQGEEGFSLRDAQLADWSDLHLLLARQTDGDWKFTWGLSMRPV